MFEVVIEVLAKLAGDLFGNLLLASARVAHAAILDLVTLVMAAAWAADAANVVEPQRAYQAVIWVVASLLAVTAAVGAGDHE
ncbi:hypothetical protein [Pseudomonas putida]|uniref:hypothetical protein n=1 Tax=Pseudomonas putida TaxID=303 RepID=UPI00130E9345|nr:hypothetical protein [Pseudomonas putida]